MFALTGTNEETKATAKVCGRELPFAPLTFGNSEVNPQTLNCRLKHSVLALFFLTTQCALFAVRLTLNPAHWLAAQTYRVYYSRPEPDGSDDYLVDHTVIMYLISPSGEFVQHYGQLMTSQEMAAGIAKKILSYSE